MGAAGVRRGSPDSKWLKVAGEDVGQRAVVAIQRRFPWVRVVGDEREERIVVVVRELVARHPIYILRPPEVSDDRSSTRLLGIEGNQEKSRFVPGITPATTGCCI